MTSANEDLIVMRSSAIVPAITKPWQVSCLMVSWCSTNVIYTFIHIIQRYLGLKFFQSNSELRKEKYSSKKCCYLQIRYSISQCAQYCYLVWKNITKIKIKLIDVMFCSIKLIYSWFSLYLGVHIHTTIKTVFLRLFILGPFYSC